MRAGSWSMVACGLLWPSIVLAQTPVFDAADYSIVNGNPVAIAVGDVLGDQHFDGKHHLDVVTANFDTASVTLLAGDGTGAVSANAFGSYGNSPAGTVPSGMVMGLIDGDDVPDIVVSNANTATVSFLKGTRNPDDCPGQDACFVMTGDPIILLGSCSGDATFACDPNIVDAEKRDQCTLAGKGTCTPVGGPGGVAIGDLNGDSFPDLAVAAEGNGDADGTVSVLFGRGDGTFDVPAARPSGSHSTKVVIADFNDDHKNDIAVVNAGSNDVAVFLGDGAGHFAAPLKSGIGGTPTGVAVGDFDEDSRLDLAISFVSASAEGVVMLKGDGHGHFTLGGTFPAGANPSDIAAADVNGDHHLDVAVSNKRSADTSVLFGDGKGGFARPRTFVTNGDPLSVAIADLNEDGRPDLLTGDATGQQQGDLAVLLNHNNTRFIGVEDFAVGESPTATASGDINGDAFPDLAVAFDPQTVRIFLAATNGDFVAGPDLHVGDSPRALSFADFNGDGKLDLAVVNAGTEAATTGTLFIFLGRGDGSFAAPQTFTTVAKPVACAVGDFDNNRIPDLAIVSLGNPGTVSIFLGSGNGSFHDAGHFTAGDTPRAVVVGKFNGDAFQDLLVANSVSGDVSILLGNGNGTFHSGGLVGIGNTSPVAIALLDVDRDGLDDFAVVQTTPPGIVVFNGNGNGGFTRSTRACVRPELDCGVGTSPSGILARDFDGDGRPDLAVSNEASNTVSLLTSTATGRLQRTAEIIISRQPVSIEGADFDGSGRYSIATGNASTAMNVSRLTNSGAIPVLRGDSNADGRVSAADLIAAALEVSDGDSARPEDAGRSGYMPSPCVNGVCPGRGIDADGDGVITPQDIRATAVRIFIGG